MTISPGTVRKHLENIFQRLAVQSRTAAVAAVSSTLTD
ncbi:MAG TPA: LuxR C-terminal-related transcriptional regulator [Marmoricola sp.]|nr:LuxR C-terminal-related transcriptional regulator [Marmoricola sp.]